MKKTFLTSLTGNNTFQRRGIGNNTLNYTLSIYSQGGNTLFPSWEHFIPKVGIIRPLRGKSWFAVDETFDAEL